MEQYRVAEPQGATTQDRHPHGMPEEPRPPSRPARRSPPGGRARAPAAATNRKIRCARGLDAGACAACRGRQIEMLHRIGEVGGAAIDARGSQQLVQEPAGRSDEWPARRSSSSPGCSPMSIRRASGTFAGHGLGCEAMERAALTGKQFSFQQICRVLVGRRGRRARRGCPLSSPGG